MKILKILLLALSVSFLSCDEDKENTNTVCNVNNPLDDLPWLRKIVNEFEHNAVELDYNPHAIIHQCMYKDGIGFLLEMCVGCPDTGYSFRNCEGQVLCGGGGITGEDNCSELGINFESRKIIWEKKRQINN